MKQFLVTARTEHPPEGMLFVRIGYILTTMVKAPLVAACLLIITLSSFAHAFGSTKSLEFTIYVDGTTHVFYQTNVDSQSPDLTLDLFGNNTANMVIQDENGTILASKATTNTATIETLGASNIKVDYDTPDLVSKSGKTWTFHVNSPIDYSVLLPKNTVIVGMTTSPINLQVVDDQSLISLPSGESDISYVFGSIGTSQTANIAIKNSQDFINTINTAGIKTPLALEKLGEAQSAFNQGKYSDAESLANIAKNTAIQEQQNQNSSPISGNALLPVLIGASVAVAGSLIIIIRKRSKTTSPVQSLQNSITENKGILYQPKQDLREDDKAIVEFISEKGGQAFESELRKKFLMPRTTMWRAVKRLEREDVIEIEKVDQQNLIKLKKHEVDKI